MKIIQIVATFPPAIGGMETVAKELSFRLAQKGNTVLVFTSNVRSRKHKLISSNKNLTITYIPGIEIAHTPIFPGLFFELIMHAKKYDLMHVHVAQAFVPEIVYLVSKLTGVPYILHLHLDVQPSGPMGIFLAPYQKYILKRVMQRAQAVIALTKSDKALICNKYAVDADRVHIIPNGIDAQKEIKRIFKTKQVYNLLFVGRLSKQKNVPLLLEIVSKLKTPVHVDIVGDGELRGELEQMADKLKLQNVLFHGAKTAEELKEFYRKADLLIMTSTEESFSMVVLEASVYSLPSVVSNLPNIKDAYGENVQYFSSNFPSKMALEIDTLLNDIVLRNKISATITKLPRQYSWEAQILKITNIYNSISHAK